MHASEAMKDGTAADALCEVPCVDETTARGARERARPPASVGLLAETFRMLGDPTRVSIAWALSREELCVCDLAAMLGMSQSAVSHSLRGLRELRLVKFRKEGRTAFYSLDDDHIARLLALGFEHVDEALDREARS